MTCRQCGRDDGHWIGCAQAAKTQVSDLDLRNAGPGPEDQCIKDGCTNPRAVSKGPRPTKYCDEHKTGSKK
jgi:hypothetical protein